MQRKIVHLLMVWMGLCGWMGEVMGQISVGSTTAVTENFDAMAATLNLPGNWRMAAGSSPTWAAALTTVTFEASSGSPTGGGTYNWGSTTSERAVGVMTSGSFASPNSLLSYYRNTGSTNITQLSIAYDVERFRRNSAAASVQFFYSLNGSTWTAVSGGDVAASSLPTGTSMYGFNPPNLVVNVSAFTLTGLNIAPNSDFYLRWNLNTTGSNSQGIGIDNVSVTATFAAACTPPSTQASSFSATNATSNTMDLSWTNNSGDRVLVVARATSAVNGTPVNGTSYTANASFGSGNVVGTAGNFAVYDGTGSSVTVTNLSANTTYHYAVFAYNSTGTCYLTPGLTGNGTTAPPPPTVTHTGTSPAASSAQQGSVNNILYQVKVDVTAASATLSQAVFNTGGTWAAADVSNFKLRYSADATLTGADPTLGTINSGLTGGAQSLTFSGLSQSFAIGTAYLFLTADLSASATIGNTVNAAASANSDFTYTPAPTFSGSTFASGNNLTVSCTPPGAQASGFSATNITNNTMDVSWTNNAGDRVLVVARAGSAVNGTPVSGTTYSANAAFGTGDVVGTAGNFAVYDGTGNTVSLTGLSASTTYHYAIFAYNSAGTCYLTPALTGNGTTASPSVGFTLFSSSVSEIGVTHTVAVTLSNYAAPVTVSISAANNTAEAGDYTLNTTSLSFTGNGTQQVSITINQDDDFNNETFTLSLAVSSGTATLGTNSHQVTITDDEVASSGMLIITEIMYNPSTTEPSTEWFEVYNTTSNTIDINGWTIQSGASTNTVNVPVSIPPGAYRILGAGAGTCSSNAYVYSSITLTNTSDDISIAFGSTVVDQVSYSTSSPWPPSVDGVSIFLINETTQTATTNNDGANWCLSVSTCSTDKATASAANDACGAEIQLQQPTGNDQSCGFTYSFGAKNLNTNTDASVRIANLGNTYLTVTTPLTVSGPDANQFSIVSQPSSSIGPSGATNALDWTIRFTPTSAGVKTASISIPNNDSNENPCLVNLTGTGLPDYLYRSKASGNWSSAGTWEISADGSTWLDASAAPSSPDLGITIQGGHTVTINSGSVSADQIVIAASGVLELLSGATFTLNDGTGTDMEVSGELRLAGTYSQNISSTVVFKNGSKYIHNYTTIAGTIPVSTWESGSTCEIAGYTTVSGFISINLNQSFHHFTWNCTGQANEINLNGQLTSVAGNFNVASTGTANLRMLGSTNTLTIGGDLTVASGAVLNMSGSSNSLLIDLDGNFILNGTITRLGTASNCRIEFNGPGIQTIQQGVNGAMVNPTFIVINNPNGVSLLSDFTLNSIANALVLTSGRLILGNSSLILQSATTISGGNSSSYIQTNGSGVVRRLTHTGNFVFPIGNSTYNPITLNSQGTADVFEVSVIDAVYNEGITGSAITTGAVNRTWFVSESVSGGNTTTMTVQWNAADELSGFTRSACYVSHYNGGWQGTTPAASSGSGPYTRSRSGITAFSPFAVGSNGILPITLTQFRAEARAQHTVLSFATATETDNDYFGIERSTDGIQFREIGRVQGAGTTTEPQQYRFVDETPQRGLNYYRLRQVDTDGSTAYSPIVNVRFEGQRQLLLSPSPATEVLHAELDAAPDTDARWSLYNASGRQVQTGIWPAGSLRFDLRLDGLQPGAYVFRYQNGRETLAKQIQINR